MLKNDEKKCAFNINNKFSIIVPVYNTANYLEDCVKSVTYQSYDNYELFLIDNGSTDESGKIINSFLGDKRIKKLAIEVNNGISKARNLGMRESCGDYIIFLDSDDFYMDRTFLERLNDFLSGYPYDMVMFKSRAFYDDTRNYGTYRANFDIKEINQRNRNDIIKYLVRTGTYESACWDKVVKRCILIDNDLYFQEGIVGEDVEWYYRTLQYITTIAGLDGDILAHRIIRTSTSHKRWVHKTWDDLFDVLNKDYNKINYNDKMQLFMLSNKANFWYILLAMTVLFDDREEMYKRLKTIKGYRKINFSPKARVCNILVNALGMRISSKIIYNALINKDFHLSKFRNFFLINRKPEDL